MKSVFYFSKKMWDYCQDSTNSPSTYATIDGEQFSEHRTVADGDPIVPYNQWDDNILVAVVENVSMSDHGTVLIDTGTLAGRIKYK